MRIVIKPVLLNISSYNLSQMSCELSIAALYANNEISLTLTRYIELSKIFCLKNYQFLSYSIHIKSIEPKFHRRTRIVLVARYE